MDRTSDYNNNERWVQVPAGALMLEGALSIPETAHGLVLLAFDTRNNSENVRNGYTQLVKVLHYTGLATLVVNLLTPEEEIIDKETGFFRDNFNIFEQRIQGIANWLSETPETQNLGIGYFGVGPVGTAALIAAAERPDLVHAIVSSSALPDLADSYLSRITAPVLFLVGGNDSSTIDLHQSALSRLNTEKQLEIIPGATDLFAESGTLDKVIQLASQWFAKHLVPIV